MILHAEELCKLANIEAATLVAAHQMGLDAVGIEKTEDNYKTAAARIAELLPQPPQ